MSWATEMKFVFIVLAISFADEIKTRPFSTTGKFTNLLVPLARVKLFYFPHACVVEDLFSILYESVVWQIKSVLAWLKSPRVTTPASGYLICSKSNVAEICSIIRASYGEAGGGK